ncbi:MAG: CDP-2,3-bis-(O-geranylgeranyl)-sn-glycerol synthase, partial [Candidatus Altiarchaeales archaeon]|nr:CDP-2,3-bis-(O-geranylgeranyl)-sn-glycerol synthase [Candidatus Altiarchaeales archaeon]
MLSAEAVSLILESLWFILPAYMANSIANDVAHIRYLEKFSYPMDFGLKWRGLRIFGPNKTWRGLFFGVLAALLTGFLQQKYHLQAAAFFSGQLDLSGTLSLPEMSVKLAFLLGFGAMLGDAVKSFFKRRMGIESGQPAPLLDQLDYIFGAFFFAWLTVPINLDYFAIVVIITVPLHLLANFIAWLLKLK